MQKWRNRARFSQTHATPPFVLPRLGPRFRVHPIEETSSKPSLQLVKSFWVDIMCATRQDTEPLGTLNFAAHTLWSAWQLEGREWGVGSVVVGSAFLGAPRFSAQRPQNPYFEGFRSDVGQKSGAPQTQIQRPRIQRPILGHLRQANLWEISEKLELLRQGPKVGCGAPAH